MRFPMTLGGFTKVVSVGTGLLMGVLLPLHAAVVLHFYPSRSGLLVAGVLGLVILVLLLTVAAAPRAVRVEGARLVVERWLIPDFVLPLAQVTAVEAGPALRLWGPVRRVFGNGGLMGLTGLFHVRQVGVVRCWATRLNLPTVLVRRARARPLLLGVDTPEALLQALRAAALG